MPANAMPTPIKQFPRLVLALFCILALALYLLWQALLNAEQEQARARLQLEADALAHQIQTRFEQQRNHQQWCRYTVPKHFKSEAFVPHHQ